MLQPYPEAGEKGVDSAVNADIEWLKGVILGVRNIRGEMNISPSLNLAAMVQTKETNFKTALEAHQDIVINLAKLNAFSVNESAEKPKSSATAVVGGATIFVPLEGIIDFSQEARRLEKEMNKLEKELTGVSKKLENKNFLNKAPHDVVEKVKAKHAGFQEKQQKLASHLKRIQELDT